MCRVVLALLWGFVAAAQPLVIDLLEAKLLNRVRSIDADLNGVLGVAIIDLTTGRVLSHNGDVVFPQASSIKIPIMVETFQAVRDGRVKLAGAEVLNQTDVVGGSGHLKMMLRGAPLTLTVRDLITAMIETSDNTATNRLITMVGMQRVNASMEKLGLHNTRLRRIMLDSIAASRGDENVSTPLEMAKLAELIYRGKAVDQEASTQMIEIMKLVEADFRDSIPATVPVASKPGSLTGVRCETGIVFLPGRPFVLSVMSTFLDTGSNPVKGTAAAVYAHFEKLSKSNVYGNRLR